MWSIIALWLFSTATCIAISWQVKSVLAWPKIRSLHRDQKGGAYTLSYVMVIPIYLIAFCFVIETTLMLIAKLGTNYSSFAAARTAIVWLPFGRSDKVEEAARQAFVPFASGLRASPASLSSDSKEKREYLRAYQDYCSKIGASADYVRFIERKYDYAQNAVSASFDILSHDAVWDEDVSVTVTYEFPFSVPIVGRLLGRHKAGDLFVYDIQSTTTLQIENPHNDEKKLGISYVPR
ncbi:MAG: hypothetical protein RLY14_872 [Planctomycetota bacterium]|jgi:Flp pilus assembly protein TadG